MTQQAAHHQEEQPRPETFDVQVCEKIRKLFADVLTAHPEVRSLACSIDWFGAMNNSQIHHGVWLGEGGLVGSPDGIFGSIQQTLKMLETQCSRAVDLHNHLREQVAILATEAANKSEEIKRLDEEIQARCRRYSPEEQAEEK